MHIASYARKGRTNQVVLEFTEEELFVFGGQKWSLTSNDEWDLIFDPAEEGLTFSKRTVLSLDVGAVFGKTETTLSRSTGMWVGVRIPPIADRKPLRARKAKAKTPEIKRGFVQRVLHYMRFAA
jgi:hypothetical protein